MKLGLAIRTLRKGLTPKISQVELSKKAGITQTYLSLIESDEKKPSMEVLENIAESLGINIALIFWMTIEEKDVAENKREIYRQLKPVIDNMIMSLF